MKKKTTTSNFPFLLRPSKSKLSFYIRLFKIISAYYFYYIFLQRVEATASPIREARAADPQYLMMSPFGYSYYPQEIQPGFYGPAPLPYYVSYVPQPVAGNRIFLSTILNAVLPSFLKQTSTVTATSTAFTVVTSTSVPACKPVAAALQCV